MFTSVFYSIPPPPPHQPSPPVSLRLIGIGANSLCRAVIGQITNICRQAVIGQITNNCRQHSKRGTVHYRGGGSLLLSLPYLFPRAGPPALEDLLLEPKLLLFLEALIPRGLGLLAKAEEGSRRERR